MGNKDLSLRYRNNKFLSEKMRLLPVLLASSATADICAGKNYCTDITNKITRTNDWPTCRACFNLRVNFNVRDQFNGNAWDSGDYLYLAFGAEVKFHKAAGPVDTMEDMGKDGEGNYVFKVKFINGHEFGDGRIDFNAEFEQTGNEPVLAWARSCPCGGTGTEPCSPEDITMLWKGGSGSYECKDNWNGKVVRCKAVCKDGSYPKPRYVTKCYKQVTKRSPNAPLGVWNEAEKTRAKERINCTGKRLEWGNFVNLVTT